MVTLRFSRGTLGVLAMLFLAACSGPLGRNGAPPAMTPAGRQSWMAPAAQGDLLYISELYSSVTNVYTYPRGQFVGSLTYPGSGTGGLCSDKAGDIFITTAYAIYEYQHGFATPVATIAAAADGCSIDPITGDLAAAIPNSGVSIYRAGPRYQWHLPRLYKIPRLLSCGYDGKGNLFVDGVPPYFKELPRGGSKFENVSLSKLPKNPGNIEWDGRYVAVGDGQNLLIRRFAISGTRGTQVGMLHLAGPSQGEQFWIQGNTIIAPAYSNGWIAGFWRYPHGGFAYNAISETSAYGATVSVAK
jgi:hypothetical protein